MCVGTGDTTHKGHKQWESVLSSHGVGHGIKCRPSGMEADACPCWARSQVLWSLTFHFSYQTVEWDKGAQDTFPRAHWDVNIFCIHVTIARPGRKRWKKYPKLQIYSDCVLCSSSDPFLALWLHSSYIFDTALRYFASQTVLPWPVMLDNDFQFYSVWWFLITLRF